MPKKLSERQLQKQLSATWSNLLAQFGEVFEVRELSQDEIKDMLRDESIVSGVKFFALNVASFISNYMHPDPNISFFVRSNIETLDRSLELVVSQIVFDMAVYGYSVSELVWSVKNDSIRLRRIVPLDPSTVTFKVENGEIVTAVQKTAQGDIEIPVEKTLIVRNGRGVYGESLLVPIYRVWRFKKMLLRLWAIAMERYAIPVIVGKTPGDLEELAADLRTLWSNGVIATRPNVELDLLEPKAGIASVFINAIDELDTLIYRGLSMPRMLIGNIATGSYALGKVHQDMFITVVKQTASAVAAEIIDQVVTKLLMYNYGELESYGSFAIARSMSAAEMQLFSTAINALVNSGIIKPERDGHWVRQMMGLPSYNDEEGDMITRMLLEMMREELGKGGAENVEK